MNHIIEQQKEIRNKIVSILFAEGIVPKEKLKDADLVISQVQTQTHQATIAEVVRIAEGMKKLDPEKSTLPQSKKPKNKRSRTGHYNKALTDLIEAITSNKE
jgi:alpha-galactosidase/6-phospho-beta-glucosidase family protein